MILVAVVLFFILLGVRDLIGPRLFGLMIVISIVLLACWMSGLTGQDFHGDTWHPIPSEYPH